MRNTNIHWAHHTWNSREGCDKCGPECIHCYIVRLMRQQHRIAWGHLYLTKTWNDPPAWQKEFDALHSCIRVFACSLSDFFHPGVDNLSVCPDHAPLALSLALPMHSRPAYKCGSPLWRDCAWQIIRDTPIWCI